jgi:hypothetical protein
MTEYLKQGVHFESQAYDFILFTVFNTTNKCTKYGYIKTIENVYHYSATKETFLCSIFGWLISTIKLLLGKIMDVQSINKHI